MLEMTTQIETEGEKLLTVGQELQLLRAAFARAPTRANRGSLAYMLQFEEQFDEVIGLLGGGQDREFHEEILLAQAHISREQAADNAQGRDAASRAFALAKTDPERAVALAARGKCETRLGLIDKAEASLKLALSLDPHNKDACKRLAALALEAGRADELLALLDRLQEQGANHARLFGARVLAHARRGDIVAAREAEGFERLHRGEQLPPPNGWDSIDTFNAALAEELLAHPGMRYERYGSASELTWRIENPARPDAPLFKALIGQIVAALGRHSDAIAADTHSWAAARPERSFLRNWCVITESTGFETWHVHQFGWMSGVYYVRVPASIAQGTSRDGCLAFGLPDELVGSEASAGFGERLVRPQEGMLLTFPSHVYHRTYPHGTGEKRICVAFDLRPA